MIREIAIAVALGASGCSLIDGLSGDVGPPGSDASLGDGAPAGWQPRAELDNPRSAFGIAVIANKIYVVGGNSIGVPFVAFTDEYDPVENVWSRKTAAPTARVIRGGSNAVVDGIAWFVGGTVQTATPGQCTAATEGYDPSNDSWATGMAHPDPLCGLTALAVGGSVYAIGGNTEVGFRPMEVRRYEPTGDAWSTLPMVFPGTRSLAAGVELGGRLYLIGGSTSPFAIDIYNPVTDVWSRGEDLPTPRSDLAAAAVGDKIYVAGGIDDVGMARDLVHIYDPANDAWSVGPPMPKRRSSFALATVGNTLYAIGGDDGTGPIADVDALTIPP